MAADEAWRENFHIGQHLDATDSTKAWCEAVVIKHTEKKVQVRFRGWGSTYDEWFPRTSRRLAPAYSHVKQWRDLHKDDSVQVGTIRMGKKSIVWHNAVVMSVHYGDNAKKGSLPVEVQVKLHGGEVRWVDVQDDLLSAPGVHKIARVPQASKTSVIKLSTQDHDDGDGKKPAGGKNKPWYASLEVSSPLEVLDEASGHWHEARVVDARAKRVAVRFRGWPWKYDVWIERDHKRLAPPRKHLGDWRAFDAFGSVQIGVRENTNRDDAKYWAVGLVTRKSRSKSTRRVTRVEVNWKDPNGDIQLEWRDADDDYLAPMGVPTYPPLKLPADTEATNESHASDGMEEIEGVSTDHESAKARPEDDQVVDLVEEAEKGVHDDEHLDVTVADEPPTEPLSAGVNTSGSSAVTTGATVGATVAKPASLLKREIKKPLVNPLSAIKRKIEDLTSTIEDLTRTKCELLALVDTLQPTKQMTNVVAKKTQTDEGDARPTKRQARKSQHSDDEHQAVWEGVAPPSTITPAHL